MAAEQACAATFERKGDRAKGDARVSFFSFPTRFAQRKIRERNSIKGGKIEKEIKRTFEHFRKIFISNLHRE